MNGNRFLFDQGEIHILNQLSVDNIHTIIK